MAPILRPPSSRKHGISLLTRLGWYDKIELPDLTEHEICLWKGSKNLWVMVMPKVMSELLDPEKMLSLRLCGESLNWSDRKSPCEGNDDIGRPSVNPAADILDYDIVNILHPASRQTVHEIFKNRKDVMHKITPRCKRSLTVATERAVLARTHHLLASPHHGARYPLKSNVPLAVEDNNAFCIRWTARDRVDSSNLVWPCAVRHYNTWGRHAAFSAQNSSQSGESAAAGGNETHRGQKSAGETGNSGERKPDAVIRPTNENDNKDSAGAPLPEDTARVKKRVEAVIEQVMSKDSEAVQRDVEDEPGSTAAAEDGPADDPGD